MVIIFWDFLMLDQIFFHHKWIEAWLLVINMACKSCLTSSRTTIFAAGGAYVPTQEKKKQT